MYAGWLWHFVNMLVHHLLHIPLKRDHPGKQLIGSSQPGRIDRWLQQGFRPTALGPWQLGCLVYSDWPSMLPY